jgi:hypothetical protein
MRHCLSHFSQSVRCTSKAASDSRHCFNQRGSISTPFALYAALPLRSKITTARAHTKMTPPGARMVVRELKRDAYPQKIEIGKEDLRREDEELDEIWYGVPRFVGHVDEG